MAAAYAGRRCPAPDRRFMWNTDVWVRRFRVAGGDRRRETARMTAEPLWLFAAQLGDRATYLRTDTYREALARVGRPVVVHEPTSHAALRFVEQLRTEG